MPVFDLKIPDKVVPANRPRRILVVDDDRDFAESLLDVLEPHGFAVTLIDAAEAVGAMQREVDGEVALIDIRLGIRSGVDLLPALRADHPDLVCVMMTAHVDSKTAIEALRMGAYDYLDKSAHPGELLAVLERCFERRDLQASSRAAMRHLLESKEAAEASSRAKSEFLATISHELRTPLNAVIGFSEVMLGQVFGPLGHARYLEYAKDIHNSGTHLLGVINDILDLTRAEAGKLDLHDSTVDVAAVALAACRLVRTRAEAAKVTLDTAGLVPVPALRADERKVQQILLNLLSNAIKFTPRGGGIWVATHLAEDGTVGISVRDTGIGMTREHIQKALEPFGQVDSSLSRSQEGTGLGLPLVAAMIERHGGKLRIDSDFGVGTTVHIVFPRERVATPADPASAAEVA